jgi:hypothetical protein
VDEAGGLVWLRGTKTAGAPRHVPLVTPEQRSLVAHALALADVSSGLLFAPWGSVRRDLRAACQRAGIEPCSPNDLRRTLAHWLRAAGAPADLVAPVLGHVDTRMVQRVYGRLSAGELAGALTRAIDCSTGAAEPAQQPHPSASSDSEEQATNAKNPGGNRGSGVPRDGVEPPTRGFSSHAQAWPKPLDSKGNRGSYRRQCSTDAAESAVAASPRKKIAS